MVPVSEKKLSLKGPRIILLLHKLGIVLRRTDFFNGNYDQYTWPKTKTGVLVQTPEQKFESVQS